jgi:hypothetical protein
VVDAAGSLRPGASVGCLGLAAASGPVGEFSIPGVPTVSGRVACRAEGTGAGGEPLAGASAVVSPVPGGTTDVGDIVLAPREVFFGALGGLFRLDRAGGDLTLVPVGGSFAPATLSALAFDDRGGLYATLADFNPEGNLVNTLVRLDPDTGGVLEVAGVVQEEVTGAAVPVGDLAYDALNGRLLAVAGDGTGGEALWAIEPATAKATVLGDLPEYEVAGVSFTDDGTLYVLGLAEQAPQALKIGQPAASSSVGSYLAVVDPASGALLSLETLFAGTLDAADLAPAPEGRKLWLPAGHELSALDPASGVIEVVGFVDGPFDGRLWSLDTRPARAAAEEQASVEGAGTSAVVASSAPSPPAQVETAESTTSSTGADAAGGER